METIELSGYTVRHVSSLASLASSLTSCILSSQHDEKSSIASTYLIPKQLKANSLPPHLLSLPPSVLTTLITSYTHEAGVRTLERQIGAVVRAKAVEYAEARDRADGDEVKGGYVKEVTEGGLEKFLGLKKFEREEEGEGVVGVSTGLSYQGSGNGGILREFCAVEEILVGDEADLPFPFDLQTSNRRACLVRVGSISRDNWARSSQSRLTWLSPGSRYVTRLRIFLSPILRTNLTRTAVSRLRTRHLIVS